MTHLDRWSHRNLDATHHLILERLMVQAHRASVLASAGTEPLSGLTSEAKRLKLNEVHLLKAFSDPSVLLDDTSPDDALVRLEQMLTLLERELVTAWSARGAGDSTFAAMNTAAQTCATLLFGEEARANAFERPLEEGVQLLHLFPEFKDWVLLRLTKQEALFKSRGEQTPAARAELDLKLSFIQGFIRTFEPKFEIAASREGELHIRCKIV